MFLAQLAGELLESNKAIKTVQIRLVGQILMVRLINKFGLGFDKIEQDQTGRDRTGRDGMGQDRKGGDRKERTGQDGTERN